MSDATAAGARRPPIPDIRTLPMERLENVLSVARIAQIITPVIDIDIDIRRSAGSGNRSWRVGKLVKPLFLEAPTNDFVECAAALPFEIACADVGVHQGSGEDVRTRRRGHRVGGK